MQRNIRRCACVRVPRIVELARHAAEWTQRRACLIYSCPYSHTFEVSHHGFVGFGKHASGVAAWPAGSSAAIVAAIATRITMGTFIILAPPSSYPHGSRMQSDKIAKVDLCISRTIRLLA